MTDQVLVEVGRLLFVELSVLTVVIVLCSWAILSALGQVLKAIRERK